LSFLRFFKLLFHVPLPQKTSIDENLTLNATANTNQQPYPATAYLKGFLVRQGYEVAQGDLGIERIYQIFFKSKFSTVISEAEIIRNSWGTSTR